MAVDTPTSTTKLHPAVTVTNIKNYIPLTLELETSYYASWAELFKIHCRAFQVIEFILPAASTSSSSTSSTDDTMDASLRLLLDAIVLQWIYNTISNDLLLTILKPDTTAAQAWSDLANIFQDNRHTRVVYLENKFSNTKLDDFPNITAYCQAMKQISDQLANVGAPVEDKRLVLQTIAGLNESYDAVAMLIQQSDPLPDFKKTRSRLVLEEDRKKNQANTAATSAATALHAAAKSHDEKDTTPPPTASRGQPPTRGRGRGRGGRGGRGRGRGNINNNNQHQQQWTAQWQYPFLPWQLSPCPFPTNAWARPSYASFAPQAPPSPSPGILGPRPHSSYAASNAGSMSTDIE